MDFSRGAVVPPEVIKARGRWWEVCRVVKLWSWEMMGSFLDVMIYGVDPIVRGSEARVFSRQKI